MKVYLLKGLFVPIFILISILFVSAIIAIFILLCIDFEIVTMVFLFVFIAAYVVAGIFAYKYSLSPENYMILKESSIYFHYVKNKNYSVMDKEINVKDILEIKYYKINSIIGWVHSSLASYGGNDVFPKRACILLNTPDCLENATIEIGYFSTKQIKNIAEMYKIPLVVHGFFGKKKYNFS